MPDIFQNLGRDLPVLVGMFVLRILFPVALVIAVGWLAWQVFAPREEAHGRRIGFWQFVLRTREKIGPIPIPEFSAGMIFALLVVALLWVAAAGFLIARFFWGLGAATALSDTVPWGLWIGFKLSCVAVAAGGFTFAGTVYVFRLEQFRPILRTAILVALLGYSTFIISLMFDLGRWYNIWHPLIMWNPHSVMFEVAWCVMLYTAVLLLEFSPALWERLHMKRMERILHNITLPLVIAGVILSTLHQSSLGSLYLILPEKLDPFWYSMLLPVYFFTSAVATGLSMMMVVPALNVKFFHIRVSQKLLASLGKPAAIVLALYLLMKAIDFNLRGVYPKMLNLNLMSGLVWVELLVGVVIPMVIFATRRGREDPVIRFRTALMVITGTVLNRMSTAVFGFFGYTATKGVIYSPSLGEWVITLALLGGAFMAYVLIVKFLPVLPQQQDAPAQVVPSPSGLQPALARVTT